MVGVRHLLLDRSSNFEQIPNEAPVERRRYAAANDLELASKQSDPRYSSLFIIKAFQRSPKFTRYVALRPAAGT